MPDTRQPTPFEADKQMTIRELAEWNAVRTRDTWRVFQIMGEYVEGYERLARCGPSVSVFGSARTPEGHPYYDMGRAVGQRLAERGYAVLTGGGPGVMEAANRGARDVGGVSVGLNIVLPHEQGTNPYVDPKHSLTFDFFSARKAMFVKYAQGFIVLPGGFGTMDELFESLTLIQTGKSVRFPVVLMGASYWQGLLDWIRAQLLDGGFISPGDVDLFSVTDSPEEAVAMIEAYADTEGLGPNL